MLTTKTALPAALLLVNALTSSVIAEARLIPSNKSGSDFTTPVFTQVSLESISESDMRRIVFYCDRAVGALDKVANSGSADIEESAADINALREAIRRLIDAGQRSGVSPTEVAVFFRQYTLTESPQSIPPTLLSSTGDFETRALFDSVSVYFRNLAPEDIDIDKINAQDLASVQMVAVSNGNSGESAAQQAVVVTPAPQVVVFQGPEIPANADPVTRDILGRVLVENGDWFIVVDRQDTLAQYAGALYGDRLSFLRIYRANQNQLSNPNALSIGLKIRLPRP